ncbi:hypothetical protein X976_6125 [Burkholderia pseudomallei MSHR7500]|nr:hypothetical protein X976_6125 [Burkholderia pseudomallei MSHR7500]
MRNVDRDVGQQLRQVVARLALIEARSDARFVDPRLLVVPRRAAGLAGRQLPTQREQRDRVALRGAAVARMQADRAGRRLRQRHRIVTAHERVHGRVALQRPFALRRPRLREHGDPFAAQQTAHEMRIRFVDLPGQLAGRIAIGAQAGQIEFERAREGRAALLPFVEQRGEHIDDAALSEDPRIGALVHQRQRVADRQLVHTELAVALADLDVADDRVHRVRLSAVGNEPDRNRNAEQHAGRKIAAGRHAGQSAVDPGHQPFLNTGVLQREEVAQRGLRGAKVQRDRTFIPVDRPRRKIA